MTEGITEIRPATADEQIVAWMDRQIQLNREILEPLHVGDLTIENISNSNASIHVWKMEHVRVLANASGEAWTIQERKGQFYPYEMRIRHNGCTFYALGKKDELTPEELQWLEDQEA